MDSPKANPPLPCAVIGAGGHARSLCSVLLGSPSFKPLFIFDLNFKNQDEDILGIKIRGFRKSPAEDLRDYGISHLFLAIGDNTQRKLIFSDFKNQGFHFPNLISSTAVVKHQVTMGEGNVIFDLAYVGPFAKIGHNNILNTGCLLEHESVVGDHGHLAPHSTVAGRVKLGNQIFLGAGATIRDNVTVDHQVTIGAGGVVVKNIGASGVYVGVPAKKIRES